MQKSFILFITFLGTLNLSTLTKQVRITNNTNQAITYNIPEYTEAIIELKKLPQPQRDLEFVKAILKEDTDRIKLIIKSGVDVNKEIHNIRPLALAIKGNKLKSFKTLLECGADYNFKYESQNLVQYALDLRTKPMPLEHSNKSINVQIVLLLIELDADFSGQFYGGCEDIMEFAITFDCPTLIKLLLAKGYNINTIGKSTQCRIVQSIKNLSALLKLGLNPNLAQYHNSWSLLLCAVSWDRFDAAKLLLEAGANPNFRDIDGKTPLAYAIERSNIQLIELLEQYGATL